MSTPTINPHAIPDPEFNGILSSDEIWFADEPDICLTSIIHEYESQTDFSTIKTKLDSMVLATVSEVEEYLLI